jgi:hypothetical protein
VINAIKFSIEEIEASDQYFDHTGKIIAFREVGGLHHRYERRAA